jgi:hypothetical protein
MWIGVTERFRRFHADLNLTQDQLDDGIGKQLGVRQSLQRAYYGEATAQPPGFMVGSWGKGTQVRPSLDVDVFFVLPVAEYDRINQLSGNKQSALLQEVKSKLQVTYPQTTMRGDGQVVIVGFNSIAVEVVPVFAYSDGAYCMPDANNGGRWKRVDPLAEFSFINAAEQAAFGNVRPVAKMIKTWRRECNVPLKSFQIELLVAEFLSTYQFRNQHYFYYDWFMRDFFFFLCGKAWHTIHMPGTGEAIPLGADWLSRAQSARDRALKACDYERDDLTISAGEEWQKIFGNRIPIHV